MDEKGRSERKYTYRISNNRRSYVKPQDTDRNRTYPPRTIQLRYRSMIVCPIRREHTRPHRLSIPRILTSISRQNYRKSSTDTDPLRTYPNKTNHPFHEPDPSPKNREQDYKPYNISKSRSETLEYI